MPIYEYQCQSCQYEFEKLQKISDAALVDCPECHTPSLKKKISAAGFRLSGSGWYETDFKSGSKKNLSGEKDASSAKDKGDSSKADSKAAPAGQNKESKTPAPAAAKKQDK